MTDSDNQRGDRPAEIEITDEMSEAGIAELYARLPDAVFLWGDDEKLVRRIFLAMWQKRQEPC